MIGGWGKHDLLVPPMPDGIVDGRAGPSQETIGLGIYWSSAESVTEKWAETMSCGAKRTRPSKFSVMENCWQYKNCDGGAKVIGCIWDFYPDCKYPTVNYGNIALDFYEHVCNAPW